ncbi:MAG TPA: ABC transporter permease [Spirochaetia bacterium]|nr:ABC transporter permease [Spirochaetia bacterium]
MTGNKTSLHPELLRTAGQEPISPFQVRVSRRRLGRDFWYAAIVPCLAFLVVPVLALLFYENPKTILANLDGRQVAQAVTLSATTTIITTLITLLIGTPVAYVLPRIKGWGHRLIETIIDLPVVLPPAVAGIALLMAFGRRGLIGTYLHAAGIDIPFTTAAVVLAQLFVAAPYFIKTASVGFAAIDPDTKEAAALDGASRFATFLYVSLPLTRNAILSGAILTFARALGEFGATIIFAGNLPGRTQTMPLAIYIGFQINLNVALALSIMLIAVSFLVMFITRMLLNDPQRG